MDGASGMWHFWASCKAREKDSAAEIMAVVNPSRPPKCEQGQVLFTVPMSRPPAEVLESILKLRRVNYVHVFLATANLKKKRRTGLEDESEVGEELSQIPGEEKYSGKLCLIYRTCASMPFETFEAAMQLWREAARRCGDERTAAADLPVKELVYCAEGKRAGPDAEHGFTSDDLKRAAGQGFKFVTGVNGSTSTYHLHIIAWAHMQRFWLGLRLNHRSLATEPTLAGSLAVPLNRKPGSRQKYGNTSRQTASSGKPITLTSWLPDRLEKLNLGELRDARDAVTPLWEMPFDEQLQRKSEEMAKVAVELAGHDQGGKGLDANVEGSGYTDEASSHLPVPTLAFPLEAIRSAGQAKCKRNKCKFQVGLDRQGKLSCGLMLDSFTVASASGVLTIADWMAAVSEEFTSILQESVGLGHNNGDALRFTAEWSDMLLRGSERTREGLAVLNAAEVEHMPSLLVERAMIIAPRLVKAAARHGQTLTSVFVRNGKHLQRLMFEDAGQDVAFVEQLSCGLQLRISPDAFFQVNTPGAEVLMDTICSASCSIPREIGCTSLSTNPEFPPLLLDVCCGGGAIGLWIANAARSAGAAIRVIGIESNKASCSDAWANAAANKFDKEHFSVICARAEHGIQTALQDAGARRAVAVIDPPREGLSPSVSRALRKAESIQRIVYVACNPRGGYLRRRLHDHGVQGCSLQSNCHELCKPTGSSTPFRVSGAVPVDLFPHTPQCELVVIFDRGTSS